MAHFSRVALHVHQRVQCSLDRRAVRDVLRYFGLAASLHHKDDELPVFPPQLAGPDGALHAVVRTRMQDHLQMEQTMRAAPQSGVGRMVRGRDLTDDWLRTRQ